MRYLVLGVVGALLVACGGAAKTDQARRPPRQAPELVAFQRNGGLAATLDTVTVRADGSADRLGATYLLRYGGRTYAARQGAVPAVLRPALTTLDAIADGAGRSGVV